MARAVDGRGPGGAFERPGDPLPGDDFLTGPLVLTRLCGRCSRPEPHRQRYDTDWGRVLLVCLRCGREAVATVTK